MYADKEIQGEEEKEEEGERGFKRTSSLNLHMISGSGSPSAVQPRRRGCNSVRVSGVGCIRKEGGSVGKGEGGRCEEEKGKGRKV